MPKTQPEHAQSKSGWTLENKYDSDHALSYHEKFQSGFGRRMSTWREAGMLRAALRRAGNPQVVLDIPCGTGRFWPLLCEKKNRAIFATDMNSPMLKTGLAFQKKEILDRIKVFQSSAFSIPFRDNSIEAVVCVRLLHHFSEKSDRMCLLREMHRVTSGSVIVTLWIDGNWKATRRAKLKEREPGRPMRDRFFVHPADIESEFQEAGLGVAGFIHFLRFYSMWAAYVLKKV